MIFVPKERQAKTDGWVEDQLQLRKIMYGFKIQSRDILRFLIS